LAARIAGRKCGHVGSGLLVAKLAAFRRKVPREIAGSSQENFRDSCEILNGWANGQVSHPQTQARSSR
jgi:hypothetical protein